MGIPPISLLMSSEEIERARPPEPLVPLEWYTCRWCGSKFQLGCTDSGKRYDATSVLLPGIRADAFQLCGRCLGDLLIKGTVEGRQAVEFQLRRTLPPGCENTDFNHFRCYEPYASRLRDVRQKVVEWTRRANDVHAVPGHFYLYGRRGPHGPGNGCGKTFLAASSYLYLARRHATLGQNLGDIRVHYCQFVSIEQLVDEFWAKRRRAVEGQNVTFRSPDAGAELSFDQYVAEIAQRNVLYLDDVGCRTATNMVKETYEVIFEARLQDNLPMFITSNYAPEKLADRIGGRAASRLFRNPLTTIVEVCAPDYPTQHALRANRGMPASRDSKSYAG